MKRSHFGGGLLILLLILGFLTSWAMSRCQEPIAYDLKQASQTALREDWEQTGALIQDAEARWQHCWHFSASLADHSPMESIDGLFAQLSTYLRARDASAVSAVCAELARQVEAMIDAHNLSWWNLL